MSQQYHMFDPFNEEDFLLRPGRLATTAGLIGFLCGIVITLLTIYDIFTIVVIPLLFGYLGLTGFWGAYNISQWFRRYRYRMHKHVWNVLRIPVLALGVVLGVCGWGVMEHFTLLLAVDAKGSIFGSQLVLLPVVGRKFAKILRRSPYQNSHNTSPPYFYQ